MKKILFLLATVSLVVACNKKNETNTETAIAEPQTTYQVFGDSITADGALSKEEMFTKYQTMKPTDTLEVKFASEIISTCKKKGCWMTLNLADGEKSFH